MNSGIKAQCRDANVEIVRAGLVLLTWGNVSVSDGTVMAIKPSGVAYDDLTDEDIVVVRIADGTVIDGRLKPSSDTPTHLHLYRVFPGLGAVVHTHSHFAVCYAQACLPIPCLGTTHSDHFHGTIPVTRDLTQEEVEAEYEQLTGVVIEETFRTWNIDPVSVPGVVVARHGPFAWGPDAPHAVENAIVLEEVARMAYHTRELHRTVTSAPSYLIDKHFLRKHGPGAYYGQT